MIDERKTLGELLSDPLIGKIAPDAIRNMDLSKDEKWGKSLEQLRKDCFGGDLAAGFETLFRAAGSGEWYYPLYSEAECAEDEGRRGTNLVRLPSCAEWNLTEGWPVAAQFNRLGYNVFVLTYQVAAGDRLLDREMDDFARAICLIRDHAEEFAVDWKRYITCGFSAGGYLVCLWNVPEKGCVLHGLPKPQAVFPVYPLVSWDLDRRDYEEKGGEQNEEDDDFDTALFGCDIDTAIHSPYEIPEHAEGFPPCAVFMTETDELVNPEHSRLLQRTLQQKGIPCRLEAGPSGGHGFADGTGMCMAGWIERAVRWYEGQMC